LREKNHENLEWKQRFDQMASEYEAVALNLKEANNCYLTQVGENEELRR